MLLLIGFFLVLGFMYSWVMNIVARDEIPVWKGAVILFGAAILFGVVSVALEDEAPIMAVAVGVPVNFASLIALTKFIAGIEWKHAAISAGIYTALLFLVGLGLAMCSG